MNDEAAAVAPIDWADPFQATGEETAALACGFRAHVEGEEPTPPSTSNSVGDAKPNEPRNISNFENSPDRREQEADRQEQEADRQEADRAEPEPEQEQETE